MTVPLIIDWTDGSDWLTGAKRVRSDATLKAGVASALVRVREKAAARRAARKANAAFCPTGKDGGIDNSCSPTGGGSPAAPDVTVGSKPETVATDKPLTGLPQKPVKIPGHDDAIPGPFVTARQAAIDYTKSAGIEYHPVTEYVKVDPVRATKIAAEYDKMQNDPSNPEVKAAYAAMAKETIAQFQFIKATGLKIDFIDFAKTGDPYAASPRLATEDVKKNNHLWVFPTTGGFGSNDKFDASANPLLADSGEKIGTHNLCVNDVFRIVHDYFGHIKEGNGFRADGEENAWRSHSAMYSELARRAMTSETRGQNSWVNYGPHGEANRTANSATTIFADQKVGLLPEWVMKEGAR